MAPTGLTVIDAGVVVAGEGMALFLECVVSEADGSALDPYDPGAEIHNSTRVIQICEIQAPRNHAAWAEPCGVSRLASKVKGGQG